MMRNIGAYWKAIVGTVVPALTTLGVALSEGSDGGGAVTPTEWVSIVLAGLTTGGLVYAVKNQPKPYGN